LLAPALAETSTTVPSAPSPATQTYDVQQTVTLGDIPKNARNVRLWISIPDDAPAQRLLDLSVTSAPGTWKIVRDRDRACRFLYVEVTKPNAAELNTTVNFSVQRSAISCDLDPAAAKPLDPAQMALFAEELRTDAPHMEVTDKIRSLAKEMCDDETNPVLQASKLLHYVADTADHYSKNPHVPTCGVGDAGSCMTKGGGCCTDLHSLFIALARATGIPARLQMGYRLQPKNVGVEADAGYRCWAEYFIGGYGWVPADVVEADAGDIAGRERWFSGLTERRVHLNEGREFDLPFRKNPARVNHMSIGYAEIDGKPVRVLPEGDKAPQLTRKVRYTERAADYPAPLAGAPSPR
jgi:transglutaminase-like putative cysteine protease